MHIHICGTRERWVNEPRLWQHYQMNDSIIISKNVLFAHAYSHIHIMPRNNDFLIPYTVYLIYSQTMEYVYRSFRLTRGIIPVELTRVMSMNYYIIFDYTKKFNSPSFSNQCIIELYYIWLYKKKAFDGPKYYQSAYHRIIFLKVHNT